jgi:flagellar protein FlaD
VIEEHKVEGVKGVTGKLVKTKDIQTFDSTEVSEGGMQPLEQAPNDPESIVVLMKWLQYLVDKTGKNNLPDVLGYYVDIGWISDDVRLDLIDYSKGITEEPSQTGARSAHLPTRDHLQSLLYIQKLKGIQLDERFLCKIEREMEKMAKSLDNYQLK